mgnify:CR=1 FL=1
MTRDELAAALATAIASGDEAEKRRILAEFQKFYDRETREED